MGGCLASSKTTRPIILLIQASLYTNSSLTKKKCSIYATIVIILVLKMLQFQIQIDILKFDFRKPPSPVNASRNILKFKRAIQSTGN